MLVTLYATLFVACMDNPLRLVVNGTKCYTATNECRCADRFGFPEIFIAHCELLNCAAELVSLQYRAQAREKTVMQCILSLE